VTWNVIEDRTSASGAVSLPVVRVGGNVKPPTKTRDVRPAYPEAAKADNVQGVVILELRIGSDGSVVDAKVMRSIPLLDDAAVAAARLWKYTPTLLNGAPVEVLMTVTIQFAL
jgi:protein TonB